MRNERCPSSRVTHNIQGMYKTDRASVLQQAAEEAGFAVTILDEGEPYFDRGHHSVSKGFKGIRVHTWRPDDCKKYWDTVKTIEESSSQNT